MSYNDGWSLKSPSLSAEYGYQGTPMALDIAAVQAIYGANTNHASGDDTYGLPLSNGPGAFWSCVWDTGGTDTISAALASDSCTINLNQAPLTGPNAGGYVSRVAGIVGGFTIANGVTIENAVGGAGADRIIGNSAANTLSGNAGNDTLNGGSGNDQMRGGAGDDTYLIDNINDGVVEAISGGIADRVYARFDYRLTENVERLHATGSDAIKLTGNALDNAIYGNSGANRLIGGRGKDYLKGGAGNDRYYVDNVGDRIVEASTGGTADRVYAVVSYKLASHVERLYASGSSSITLTGSKHSNVLSGNSGNNRLSGELGRDVLTGGSGKDTFVIKTKITRSNVDKITDFRSSDDAIWLDNNIFTKLGSSSLSKPKMFNADMFVAATKAKDREDRIIYNKAKGVLYYDPDGTASSSQVKIATISNKTKLSYHDFYII
ncbi:calcium-binding protein [Microvirga roseola]|uniref:calcium-binding protein n=1 Tax=Microvirga roseola TaxID=2883126 RepID=UPI001E4EF4F0|nr:calcium-binding protein [Microvirga roseola]